MSVRFISKWLALALAFLTTGSVYADSPDAWITTKAKIALLTADGVSITAVNVDTVGGTVTLHGKVKTEGEKERAAVAVRSVDGVKGVQNLLQVVPDAFKESVGVADSSIKDNVEASLMATGFKDVKVASVNKGVVLLSGTTDTLASKLRAIETAYKVAGVQRVASEVQTTGDR
jgi:hyperosmotically inducible periplasmic protein